VQVRQLLVSWPKHVLHGEVQSEQLNVVVAVDIW
jgi:hypothetical protein